MQITGTTAVVTNGSPIVTDTNATFVTDGAAISDGFTVTDSGVTYDIASVDSETQITLSTNYAGISDTVAYAIFSDFTSPDNIPEMNKGDIETATLLTRIVRKIQDLFTSIINGTKALTNVLITGGNISGTTIDSVEGSVTVDFVTDADLTLSTSQAFNEFITITDSLVVLTATRNIILPINTRTWVVKNSTAQTLTFKTSAGTGIAITSGAIAVLRGDGTNIIKHIAGTAGALEADSIDNTPIGQTTPAAVSTSNLQATAGDISGLSNLNVAANSSGNVSRHVMTTASAGASDANYYAKLCTFTVSTSAASYINKVLELTDTRTGSGESNVSFIARCDATGTIDTINTKVTVNKNNYSNLAHNGYFLVQPSAGILELWVQKTLNYSQFNVYELANNELDVTNTSWNDGATWQAAAPTGTTITSDWACLVSNITPSNGWSGTITKYDFANGLTVLKLITMNIGTTTDATLIGTLLSGYPLATEYQQWSQFQSGGGTSMGGVRIDTGGGIRCYNYASGTAQVTASFTYKRA